MSKNSVVHFEMPYEDKDRASRFYEQAFGWEMIKYGPEMGDYVVAHTTDTDDVGMVKEAGRINGGFFPRSEESAQMPSVVIGVEDIHSAIQKVGEAGGEVLGAPTEIPHVGLYVSFMDSEGSRVSLLQPQRK